MRLTGRYHGDHHCKSAEVSKAVERPVLFPPERDTWLQTASSTHSPATRPVYCEVSHPS
ncbi:hypothetical protein ABG768_005801 [Culter alburnus]|uniref:Uncharacterized protein n=1 Tax=Culter alburnus TaxID=194366 RepID=A0AAW1ZW11_CULAL